MYQFFFFRFFRFFPHAFPLSLSLSIFSHDGDLARFARQLEDARAAQASLTAKVPSSLSLSLAQPQPRASSLEKESRLVGENRGRLGYEPSQNMFSQLVVECRCERAEVTMRPKSEP